MSGPVLWDIQTRAKGERKSDHGFLSITPHSGPSLER